eukprot:TRINITY_DN2365_c0_g1_i6.p1 TRINITY_DN2365_c0_g1~~TRINITY_DN2365_c0_g1_i6.p1  ORF type:complete len:1423 (+),score=410.92 TRINITY_DN2365_c0_g1_i6:175-4443(+)
MFQFSAVNESDQKKTRETTAETQWREVQLAKDFETYDKAMRLQAQKNYDEAEDLFKELLDSPLIASVLRENAGKLSLSQQSVLLKYIAHSNLATIYRAQNKTELALKAYIEAIGIDASDVLVWHNIGKLAEEMKDFSLARQAYERGLSMQAGNWFILDRYIDVLYLIGDYQQCVAAIDRAIDMDAGYQKGKELRAAIAKEIMPFDPFGASAFGDSTTEIAELLDLKSKRRKTEMEVKRVQPATAEIKDYSWSALGTALLRLYRERNALRDAILNAPVHITSPPSLALPAPKPTGPLISLVDSAEVVSDMTQDAALVSASSNSASNSQSAPSISVPTSNNALVPSNNAPAASNNDGKAADNKTTKGKEAKQSRQSARREALHEKQMEKQADSASTDIFAIFGKFLPAVASSKPDTAATTRDVEMTEAKGDPSEVITETTNDATNDGSSTSQPKVNLRLQERSDVFEFVQRHRENSVLVDLLRLFVIEVFATSHAWNKQLGDLVLEIQGIVGTHLRTPEKYRLFVAELCYEHTKQTREPNALRAKNLRTCDKYLQEMIPLRGSFDDNGDFDIRLLWLQSLCEITKGNEKTALAALNDLRRVFRETETNDPEILRDARPRTVVIPHRTTENIVTLRDVETRIGEISRSQRGSDSAELFRAGRYDDVILALRGILDDKSRDVAPAFGRRKEFPLVFKNRLSQLEMLEESYANKGDIEGNIRCRSTIISESLEYGLAVAKDLLTSVLARTSGAIRDRPVLSPAVVADLGRALLKFFKVATSEGDKIALQAFLAFYRLMKLDANFDKKKSIECMATAHDILGEKSLCTINNGEFLKKFLKALRNFTPSKSDSEKGKSDSEDDSEDELDVDLERAQLFFCLCGLKSTDYQLASHHHEEVKFTDDPDVVRDLLVVLKKPAINKTSMTKVVNVLYHAFAVPPPHVASAKEAVEHFISNSSVKVTELDGLLSKALASPQKPTNKENVPAASPTAGVSGSSVTSAVPTTPTKETATPAVTSPTSAASVTSVVTSPGSVNAPVTSQPTPMDFIYSEIYELQGRCTDISRLDEDDSRSARKKPLSPKEKTNETFALVDLFKKDLFCVPRRASSWYELGRCYRILLDLAFDEENIEGGNRIEGLRNKATKCFQYSVHLNENNAAAWEERGFIIYANLRAFKKMNRPLAPEDRLRLVNSALEHFARAEKYNSENWLYPYMIGKFAEKAGQEPSFYLGKYRRAVEINTRKDEAEPLYRLHASRLKLLTREKFNDYDLLERYRFKKKEGEDSSETHFDRGPHDRSDIVSDVLDAMKECQKIYVHFHKSVYCQAVIHQKFTEPPNPAAAREIFGHLFAVSKSARAFLKIWRAGLDRAGKFAFYVQKYVAKYVDLLEATHDVANLDIASSFVKKEKIGGPALRRRTFEALISEESRLVKDI